MPAGLKQEMKYNLLPDSFGDRFDELETDWTEMSKQKFLSEAQKFEAADKKKQKMGPIPKKKRSADEDSGSGLSRAQKARNQNGKRQRTSQPINNGGVARECELCKMAGAPSFVYKSHFTSQCKKKAEYQQRLSGGTGSRQKAQKEFRATEKELKMELKLLKKINKLKKKNFGGLRGKQTDSESSEGEESD